jgi:chromosome segregation ATPase
LYFRKLHTEKSREYLVDVTAAIVVLRDRVGVLPPDLRPIYAKNLTYLKDWFRDFQNQPWPLPELPNIKKYNSLDVERSLLTEVVFEKKNQQEESKKSLYELKRLNKDYSSNPLKAFSTGILQTNSNYNDTLTHKLLQELNSARYRLDLQEQFFENFKQFEGNVNTYLKDDESKLVEELAQLKEQISSISSQNEKLTGEIDAQKEKISQLKQANELNSLRNLKEEIKAETKKLESHAVEKQYMINEIENAKNSIAESKEGITKVKLQISENEVKIENYFQDFKDEPATSDEVTILQERLAALKTDIEQNIGKLNSSKSRTNNRWLSPGASK